MKKQSFITGAFLLAAATGLGKIFSAIFKIPLDRLFLHAEGMAVFNGAYNVYMFFFAAATAGLPLAISQMVASADTKEEEYSAVSTALLFTVSTLTALAVIIFLFAEPIAAFIGIPDSAPAFRVISPALFFCGITAALRGYFQGKLNMTASALSQVSDSFGRLLAGFFGAYMLLGLPIATTCAGAASGVPFGAMLSAVILVIAAKKTDLHIGLSFSMKHIRRLLAIAVPITVTASLHPIFNMVDTFTVVPALNSISFPSAQNAFGCLSRAATLYALPVSIATAVAASVLPAVAEHTKKGSVENLNRDSSMAIRLALALSLPCAAGFMAIPEGILYFLFDNSAHYSTLVIIALSAVFLSVGEVIACILQGSRKVSCTVISAIVAILAKAVLNITLMPLWDINGAAASTLLSYLVFLLMLLVFLRRYTRIKPAFKPHVLKPLVCGALCFSAAYIVSGYFSTFISILAAALVYIPSVFVIGFIKFDEINQIFSGHKIEYNNH